MLEDTNSLDGAHLSYVFRHICIVVAAVLIAASIEEDVFINCPDLPECLCNEAITSVYCMGKNLSTIPDLPRTTQRLHLEENGLEIIKTHTFEGFPNLKYLFLTGNRIKTIETYAFAGLDNLTYLTIAGNQLVNLGNYSFANIPNLKELNLFNNAIRFISENAFVGSSEIKTIQLNSNKLSAVPSLSHQPQLRELNLQNNMIVNATFPSSFITGSKKMVLTFR